LCVFMYHRDTTKNYTTWSTRERLTYTDIP